MSQTWPSQDCNRVNFAEMMRKSNYSSCLFGNYYRLSRHDNAEQRDLSQFVFAINKEPSMIKAMIEHVVTYDTSVVPCRWNNFLPYRHREELAIAIRCKSGRALCHGFTRQRGYF